MPPSYSSAWQQRARTAGSRHTRQRHTGCPRVLSQGSDAVGEVREAQPGRHVGQSKDEAYSGRGGRGPLQVVCLLTARERGGRHHRLPGGWPEWLGIGSKVREYALVGVGWVSTCFVLPLGCIGFVVGGEATRLFISSIHLQITRLPLCRHHHAPLFCAIPCHPRAVAVAPSLPHGALPPPITRPPQFTPSGQRPRLWPERHSGSIAPVRVIDQSLSAKSIPTYPFVVVANDAHRPPL